jgi:hypothetical protein
MTTEQTVPILSFLTFFFLQLLGALWHYRVVVKSGRHMGGLWSYLIGDYKTTTVPMIAALFGTSLYSAITGTAEYINPVVVWHVIMSGQLPLTSFGIAIPIVTTGYAFDSAINSGDNEPK